MQRLTDEELVALCLKGDKDAFNLIVERYQKQVFSLAYRLGGDYDEARDMAQESFIRIYGQLDRFDPDRKFFPWMYRIAHNCCVNILAKRPKNQLSFDEVGDLSDEGAGPLNPQAVLDKTETAALVRQVLLALPDQYREPLILKYLQGYSYQEIAEALELPESTIETRLYRGRQLMQKKLAPLLHKENDR